MTSPQWRHHSALPNTRRPLLSPEQHRKLSRFWMRQGAVIRQAATRVTRAEMGQVMHPSGQLRAVASRLLGDVTGIMLRNVVVGIRGIPINATPPTDRQGLVYVAASNELVYSDLAPNTRWEPLTNGDPVDPQILFSADGDVLMSEVPN